MGLITEESTPEAAKNYILAEIKSATVHLEGSLISSFTRFWAHPNGISPQAILDSFGTDAVTLVSVFAASRDLINLITPGTISLSGPRELILNPDGTVTVGEGS